MTPAITWLISVDRLHFDVQVAFICGSIEERTRARTYLKWLLKQRQGSVYVDDLNR